MCAVRWLLRILGPGHWMARGRDFDRGGPVIHGRRVTLVTLRRCVEARHAAGEAMGCRDGRGGVSKRRRPVPATVEGGCRR